MYATRSLIVGACLLLIVPELAACTQTCETVDADSAGTVEVTLENRRSEAVFWAGKSGCLDPDMLQLSDQTGQVLRRSRSCEATSTATTCQAATAVKIPPGGSYKVPLELNYYSSPECALSEASVDRSCDRRFALPSGEYSLSASWYESAAADCETVGGQPCTVLGAGGVGERHVVTAEWSHPGGSEPVLVVE